MDKKRQEDYQQMIIERLKELSQNTVFDIPAEPNATKYYRDALYDACQLIESLPPAAQPKHGEWLWNGDTLDWERLYYCSECKKYALRDTDGKEVLSDFCPHCSAEMKR